MQINTVIYKGLDWKCKVHTMQSQYINKGKYFTCCSIRYDRGASITLISIYTSSEDRAIIMHKEISLRAKALFDLK